MTRSLWYFEEFTMTYAKDHATGKMHKELKTYLKGFKLQKRLMKRIMKLKVCMKLMRHRAQMMKHHLFYHYLH